MNGINKYRLQNLSVAIIDDHEVVLEGVTSIMQKNGVCRVEAFKTASELLFRAGNSHFDIFIIDVELPDADATSLIDSIRAVQPEARIIIHTVHEETWVVGKIAEKHIDGVVFKSAQLEQLLEAIAAVGEGHQYFCAKYKKMQNRLAVQNDIPSDREKEVLRLIAEGYSTKGIAKCLFISENTVENHRKSLFRKLKAHNVATLIINAITAGYIDPAKE